MIKEVSLRNVVYGVFIVMRNMTSIVHKCGL